MSQTHRAEDGDGHEVSPQRAVIPILKQIGTHEFRIIGTGFFITRYGFVATAAHVVADLEVAPEAICPTYILEMGLDNTVVGMRQILCGVRNDANDAAIIVADNKRGRIPGGGPDHVIVSLMARITLAMPSEGSEVVSFAYPANREIFDLGTPNARRTIECGFYDGKVTGLINAAEQARRAAHEVYPGPRDKVTLPLIEMSMAMGSGASGGPVSSSRNIVGVYSCGFGPNPPNYAIPMAHFLPLPITPRLLEQLPGTSYEAQRIPLGRRGRTVTFGDLCRWGHVSIDGSLP